MPGFLRTKRYRQPVAGGFRPSPANPLAAGIDFAFSQRGLFYCRGPIAFAQANAPSLSAVAAGVGTAYASTQATTISGQMPPIADGQGYTYLAVYVRTSTGNVGQFIQADSTTRGFQFRSESGGAPSIIAFNTANTPFTATSSVSIPAGQMAVAVSTVSPTLASIYVNGILRGSTAISGTVRGQQTTSDFTIGNRGGGNALDGTLVLLVRWNRTLTAAEVAQINPNNYWQLFAPAAPQLAAIDADGSTGTSINPGVGAITAAGYVPTIALTANQSAAPGSGAVAAVGYAPTITRTAGQTVLPGAGSLVLAGHTPAIVRSNNQAVAPAQGALGLVGHAPSVDQSQARAVAPGVGALSIAGHAPTLTQASAVQGPSVAGTTIMRESIINCEVAALIASIAAQGGTMRSTVIASTIMRAAAVNKTGAIRADAINQIVEFI